MYSATIGIATCATVSTRTPWCITLGWVLLTACGSDKSTAPATGTADPEQAVLVTSDIERFWKAYDDGGASGATAPFQTEYLDRASPGLKDFIASRDVTAASLALMVRKYPRYFADIRASTLGLASDGGRVQGRDARHQGNATGDRPGDLGYFIGYRIAEAFYEPTSDKRLALRMIIEVGDSDVFLAQSGYDP